MYRPNAQLHEVTQEGLAVEFPEWLPWQSSGGQWWAVRGRVLTTDEMLAGLYMTLGAKTLGALRDLIVEQVEIESGLIAR